MSTTSRCADAVLAASTAGMSICVESVIEKTGKSYQKLIPSRQKTAKIWDFIPFGTL